MATPKFKQKCARCKKNMVLMYSWKQFPVCDECQLNEIDEPIEDKIYRKLFDIDPKLYKESYFLRNIKMQYLRKGILTEKQVEVFKKVAKELGGGKAQQQKEPQLLKITYFVHGTTTYNEKEKATGWEPGELSKTGKKQCMELRAILKKQKMKFDVIFCSDLKRAVESAEILFPDAVIIPDKRLREANYGDLTGKGAGTFKNKLADFVNAPFPNGESYKAVEKRMAEFLNDIFEKHPGKHIAIVAHQAPQLALDVLVKGKTWEQAIKEDWRLTRAWQPGWEYAMGKKVDAA